MRKLSVCTLALCLGFASITHADTVTKIKFKGNTAGGFASTGDDPCFYASVSASAADQVTRDSTGATETKEIFVDFFGFDNCKSLSYSGFAVLPLTSSIANQSQVAIPFDLMVDVYELDSDVPFEQQHVVGTATINATGNSSKSRQADITQDETMRTVTRSKGTTREASMDVTARLDDVQIAFVQGFGEIGSTKSGTLEVTRF